MIELCERTEALARRLAAVQDLTVDETVRQALEAREASVRLTANKRDRHADRIDARRDAIDRFVRRVAATPILDPRTPHAIMDDLDPL